MACWAANQRTIFIVTGHGTQDIHPQCSAFLLFVLCLRDNCSSLSMHTNFFVR